MVHDILRSDLGEIAHHFNTYLQTVFFLPKWPVVREVV